MDVRLPVAAVVIVFDAATIVLLVNVCDSVSPTILLVIPCEDESAM